MDLIIASNNKHKTEEIAAVLADKFEKTLSLAETNIVCNPSETGSTFFENALIKAEAVAKICKLRFPDKFAVLADDTGLCVDSLGGAPGIYSARYAANEIYAPHDDKANREKLLTELNKVCDNLSGKNFDECTRQTLRKAHFESAVVLIYPNGKIISASGRVDGFIAEEERGKNGFGYDSLFFCCELGKTFAEASQKEKNRVSHRGKALENLLKML